MDEFFDGKRSHESFAGEGFALELIRRYGIRVSELGDYSMEYDLKTPEQQAEVCNVVRFAVNRSMYTQEHMAGTIGGTGLGQIAITYGYQRQKSDIIWVCVVLTIIIVQIIQEVGMPGLASVSEQQVFCAYNH